MADQEDQAAAAATDQSLRGAAEDQKPKDQGKTDTEGQQDQGQDTEDELAITKFYDQTHGRKRSGQFKSDLEFFNWVDEMESLLGRRDGDAQVGKQLREQFGGQEVNVAAMLAAHAKQETDESLPEWDPNWLVMAEDGSIRPGLGAPKDVLQRYFNRLNTVLAGSNKSADGESAERLQKLEDQTKQAHEEIAQERARTKVESLCSENRNLLYVGGDPESGMTGVGQQILAMVSEAADAGENPVPVLERSLRLARTTLPKQGTNKVSKRATHQASVATGQGRSDEEIDKMLAARGGLSKLAKEMYDAKQAAGASG